MLDSTDRLKGVLKVVLKGSPASMLQLAQPSRHGRHEPFSKYPDLPHNLTWPHCCLHLAHSQCLRVKLSWAAALH